MTRYLVAYAVGVGAFLALDFLWLGVVARDLYRREYGTLLLTSPNMAAAAGFYLAYVAGVVIFAVSPAFSSGTWTTALIYGGLFGFFCYGTYNMTGLAVIRDWPPLLTAVDIAWGTVLTALVAVTAYAIATRFA